MDDLRRCVVWPKMFTLFYDVFVFVRFTFSSVVSATAARHVEDQNKMDFETQLIEVNWMAEKNIF